MARVQVVARLPGQGRLKGRDEHEDQVAEGKDSKDKNDTDHGAADIPTDEP